MKETVQEMFGWSLDRLTSQFEEREARNILKILFEDVFHQPDVDAQIVLHEEKGMLLEQYLNRILDHEPIQYITGRADFYGYTFHVSEDVLVPRPETEELVYEVLKSRNEKGQCRILDIGVGSGCIAISIKKEWPEASVMGLEVSPQAIAIAEKNIEKHQVNLLILELDFLNEAKWPRLGTFDVIVSNPPYIPVKEKDKMQANVLDYEPHLALFVEDEDPLLFYRKIQKFAQQQLNRGGEIFLECNEFNIQEVANLFSNFKEVEKLEDMQGKERILKVLGN